MQEKGDVRTDGGGDFVQSGGTEFSAVKLVEAQQGACRVTAAAAQACAVGNGFVENDGVPAGDSGLGFVGSHGLDHEIRSVARNARVIAMEGKLAGVLKFEAVGQPGEFHHNGVDFMKSVVALS